MKPPLVLCRNRPRVIFNCLSRLMVHVIVYSSNRIETLEEISGTASHQLRSLCYFAGQGQE